MVVSAVALLVPGERYLNVAMVVIRTVVGVRYSCRL